MLLLLLLSPNQARTTTAGPAEPGGQGVKTSPPAAQLEAKPVPLYARPAFPQIFIASDGSAQHSLANATVPPPP